MRCAASTTTCTDGWPTVSPARTFQTALRLLVTHIDDEEYDLFPHIIHALDPEQWDEIELAHRAVEAVWDEHDEPQRDIMTLHHSAGSADEAVSAGERSTLRAVAMPTEHGGWSLTLEPVLLGLLVAWSWPGLALGVAAMLAFLARTPLKLVLVDRWRGRWLMRTTVAARVAAVELLVLVALVVVAAIGADARFWWPLLAAAPLVAIELWFDMRSRSRRLLPELAGTVGIGSVAAAIALADGADTAVGVGTLDRRRGTRRSRDPLRADTGVPHPRQAAPALAQRPRTSTRRGRDRRRMVGRRRSPRCRDRDHHSRRVQRRSSPCRTATGQGHRAAADVLRDRRRHRHRDRRARMTTPQCPTRVMRRPS